MVAIIHNSKCLRNALHYNENKVRQKLQILFMQLLSKDVELLSFNDKINWLEAINKTQSTNDFQTEKLKAVTSIYSVLDSTYKVSDIDIAKLNYDFIKEYKFCLKTDRKCNHNSTMKYPIQIESIKFSCIIKMGFTVNKF
jgi:hypothetical protein